MLEVAIRHERPGFTLDVAFAAPPGVTVLFGRSGAGKTTIVDAVAGLLRPDRGRVAVDGRILLDTDGGICLPPHRRSLGVIFQDGRLFPHRSVRANLLYGRRGGGDPDALDRTVAMLGIGHLLDRRPPTLSGGERQRVAIGRALLARPRLVLADEPLAALDEPRKAEILPYLERLRDEVRVPVLYVSHSVAEVARLATTVVALEAGRVARAGPAAAVLSDPMVTPLGARAAGAVVEARLVRQHADGLSELEAGGVPLFVPRVEVDALRLRIAAQDVILSRAAPGGLSALNVLPGTVEAVREGGGPGAIVSVATPAGRVLARVTKRSADALGLRPGTPVHAIVKALAIAPEDVGR